VTPVLAQAVLGCVADSIAGGFAGSLIVSAATRLAFGTLLAASAWPIWLYAIAAEPLHG
jgi:hypothetical protein